MIRLTYDPELVEEAVLLAEPKMARVDARSFRQERDRIYEVVDAEAREARFRTLHLGWFARLGLNRVVERSITERPDVTARVAEGRVVRALTGTEEGADLIDRVESRGSDARPMLVLRLRPAALARGDELLDLLRHELQHVADMLDPAFGYQRTLRCSDDGPSSDNVLRDRYRVLWDVTIDGRLVRAGLLGDHARSARWREFAGTFGALGDRCRSIFDEWFDRVAPTHAALVAFAVTQRAAVMPAEVDPGRCPLCRFPIAALDPSPERLSPAARAAIAAEHFGWTVEQGLCLQCLDLYEARYAEKDRFAGR